MKKKSILVVDDNPMWLEQVRILLKAAGYKTDQAYDGIEALEMLGSKSYDAVLTDTNMPRMNGVKLLSHIRQRWPKLPVVIFFDGLRGSTVTEEDLEKMGAKAILNKDQLLKLVEVLRKLNDQSKS